MLSLRRTSIEDEEENNGLLTKHFPSTPHLDVYLVTGSKAGSVSNGNSNYIQSPLNATPKMSTFSTFAHHKSGADLRYRDDPNPYKVSTIDEFRIQTHDPYKTKSTNQLNTINQNGRGGIMTFYNDGVNCDDSPLSSPKDDFSSNRSSAGMSRRSSATLRSFSSSNQYESDSLKKFYPGSEASQNSGEYEIPDPDYDGSTGGSSEELPIPPLHPPRSDSSEEYSQLSISASSNSGGLSPSPLSHHENENQNPETPTKISEIDRHRVESALKGRKTWIYVADSLANLYYMSKSPSSAPSGRPGSSQRLSQNIDWILKYTGVPVLLLDTGETRSRDKRKIQIVLAEMGSGLALWKDVVDNLTSYQIVENDGGENGSRSISTFHTMHMSSDHSRVVGLSFDNADTADKFAQKVDKLTSDFANISLSGSKSKSKKKDGKQNDKSKATITKYIRPKKSDISQPCCFQHVSSLSPNDKKLFSSLQQFVTPKGGSGSRSLSSNSPITSDISF